MEEIQVFSSSDFGQVRTMCSDASEPLFCLADVCAVLGLTNPTTIANSLDEDEKPKFNLGYGQDATFITESGLYTVIMRSRKPMAKKFRKWVTGEVLPTIRKTGRYEVKPEPRPESKQLNMELIFAKSAADVLNLNDASRLSMMRRIQDKYDMVDMLPTSVKVEDALFSASELLKKFGYDVSTRDFNNLLVSNGFLRDMKHQKKNGREVTFRNVTEQGKKYGDNFLDSHSSGVTQPKWYESKFIELCNAVGLQKQLTEFSIMSLEWP